MCFSGVQASQEMSARKNQGDGSDCPPCRLHDGDLSSLERAQRLSLLGYEIQKKILRGLENRLGDVPDESKIAFGGGFGQGYPSKSFLDLFWTRF